jgi:tRNA pseudouridine38-40 synthase
MRRVALRLAYDGTEFAGSQWQPSGRTVQGELEAAWTRLTQERRRFTFAGRTDAGVHAEGQVAHVATMSRHSLETIRRALNALLPEDVVIHSTWEVDARFHARFSAEWRHYRYLIDNSLLPLPMLRRYVLHVAYPLDRELMQEALGTLAGEHDFAAFAAGEQRGTTVRACHRASCDTFEWFNRPLLAIELVANGFLRHMVRNVVGTLLLVGQGKMTCEEFVDVLRSRDRRQAGPTAAPHGLSLVAVGYPAAAPDTMYRAEWLDKDE